MSATETANPSFQEQIDDCRRVGLEVLKASPRDLEAGLALHKDAIVVEPYSLGIYAGLDWERVQAEQNEGASAVELRDGMEDQGVLGHLRNEQTRAAYRQAWEASGVTCTFQGAGEEGNNPMRLIKRLARYTHLIDAMPDFLGRVTSTDDILENHRRGRRSICFGLNGVPLAGTQVNAQDEMAYIRVFAQLGAKIMHLTYNRRNPLADGCGEIADGGLSTFGHQVVAEMNRLGIIIDLAHTGWKSSIDTAKASSQPVLVSHSCAWSLNPHVRCKPDEVIRAIAETNGVVCVTNIPAFLGRTGDIVALLDHIDYLVKKFGVDYVGIGTDELCLIPSPAPLHPVKIKMRLMWENLWPDGTVLGGPLWKKPEQTKSLAWTNYPLFTVGLVQRGYSEEEIRKILGGNVLRVAKACWQA